ncbi:MAG: hypothetical protein QOG58_5559, partial [Caballeronia sp.]|nr:hypothetical protein [Caballeronia sp.]
IAAGKLLNDEERDHVVQVIERGLKAQKVTGADKPPRHADLPF